MLKIIYFILSAVITIYIFKFNTNPLFLDASASSIISLPLVRSYITSQFAIYSALIVALVIYLIEFDK